MDRDENTVDRERKEINYQSVIKGRIERGKEENYEERQEGDQREEKNDEKQKEKLKEKR